MLTCWFVYISSPSPPFSLICFGKCSTKFYFEIGNHSLLFDAILYCTRPHFKENRYFILTLSEMAGAERAARILIHGSWKTYEQRAHVSMIILQNDAANRDVCKPLWKIRAVMEKMGSYGKDGQFWKRWAVMEKMGSYEKDGQFWKRRAVMEKMGSYEKDGQLWKRRAVMKKTGNHGKDRQLWKRQTVV